MDELESKLRAKKGAGAKYADWEASAEGDALKMQRVHTAQIYAQTLNVFHASVPLEYSMDVQLGSGPEAGAYLIPEEGAPR